MRDSKAILSSVISHMKYAKFLPAKQRRETWVETTQRSADMHIKRFPHLKKEIIEAFKAVRDKKILQSMRSAQFAGLAIETKNNRIYNCAYCPADSAVSVSEIFYNLLCGSGVGFSVQSHHVANWKPAKKTVGTAHYVVDDSIEGWADSIKFLLNSYSHGGAPRGKPVFDYSQIRPEGALLVTSGGRAPGPAPLKTCHAKVQAILESRIGKRLRTIDVYDMICHIADAVHAGGIRRAALIAFFDRTDDLMLRAKSGNWWETNIQRARSNNSAVFIRGEVGPDEFKAFWDVVQQNGTGEPGIYWTWDRDVLANPCVEIALNPFQFCNLTTVNAASCKSEMEFIRRCILAARIGTLQAAYTDFDYLRPSWQQTTEQEALIGVSITGIGAGMTKNFNLERAAAAVVAENQWMAKKLGINAAARVTCIKPEGTGSLVLGTASGIHSWHSPYYFRSIRMGKNEAIYKYLLEVAPSLVEDEIGKEATHAVFRCPIQANAGGHFRKDENAIDLLGRVKRFSDGWIKPGHIAGPNSHNISCTVSVRQEEWKGVGDWMWQNRESYVGLTVMPYAGGEYHQAPFQAISKEDYAKTLPLLQAIDVSAIVEREDNTSLVGEMACSGGVCGL